MKIIERTQDLLILRHRGIAYLLFMSSFVLMWLVSAIIVLVMFPGALVTFGTCMFVAVISGVTLWFSWWDVTAQFDKIANQVAVTYRGFRGTKHDCHPLSDLESISYDTDIDSDTAKVMLSFGAPTDPLILPARQHRIFRPYNSYVEGLIADISDWSGRDLIRSKPEKPGIFI